ncbi:hypothetical protein E1287_38625 [Actinomadura sp. KC06]|uniref:hypothetical protein n=1 Tax=Actinomadura sp. KC06 TaxID=2530369 RepID=UPI00104F255A|nr:hypothetical protein [Actinomadura sp. KC06]TDD23805.1 hypothetical protein E1287_38625 [Actinomadura sp. KC06]
MKIDLHDAVATVEELLAGLRELDGTEIDEAPTRAAQRQRTNLTRSLLYLSHLGDRASVQVMDSYHAFKTRDLAKIRDEPSEE